MLVSVQRVCSPTKQGINAFLYSHEGALVDPASTDLALLVDEAPGSLRANAIEVPPGGNDILSYLDIVAPEGTSTDRIQTALANLAPALIEGKAQVVKEGEVQARFFAVLRLMSSARDEFEQLAQRALSLLENPRPAIRSVAEAIILDLCPTDQGWSISVGQKSVPRLLSLHGPDWKQVVLGIPTEIWGGIGTSMLNNLVPVVTGLDLDAIGSVGGAKVINSETGAPVWEWPPPSALEGHCLGCHRRDSLRHMPGGFYECTICGNRQDNAGLPVSTLT